MADKVTKTTSISKPRKTAAKKKVAEVITTQTGPSREEIEQLAKKYWAERGYQDGYAEHDWLRAEHELRSKAS